MKNKLAACMSSDKLDYETPDEFFKKLHKEFKFTIDLAANTKNHKLPRWFGPGSKLKYLYAKKKYDCFDALKLPWENERGWLNPPYGSQLKHWIEKAYYETRVFLDADGKKAKVRDETLVVMLIPARTDTSYWHDYVMKAEEIRYIRGRLKFKGTNSSAPFPSAVVVFGRK